MSIELQDVNISYGIFKKKRIIKNLNLVIESGKVTVLYGQNGCGKTTLLRCLSGQLNPDSGKIVLDNKDITGKDYFRRVNSSGNFEAGKMLYQYATLKENVQLNTFLLKSISLTPLNVEKIRTQFNISEIEDSCIDEMSLGQRQKSALYVALRKPASLYFFDEPDNGLDRYMIETLSCVLKSDEYKNSCILLATHDSLLIHRIADSILFFNKSGFYQKKREDLPTSLESLDKMLSNFIKTEHETV